MLTVKQVIPIFCNEMARCLPVVVTNMCNYEIVQGHPVKVA